MTLRTALPRALVSVLGFEMDSCELALWPALDAMLLWTLSQRFCCMLDSCWLALRRMLDTLLLYYLSSLARVWLLETLHTMGNIALCGKYLSLHVTHVSLVTHISRQHLLGRSSTFSHDARTNRTPYRLLLGWYNDLTLAWLPLWG